MVDYVKRKHEFDILANKVKTLQHELNTAKDDIDYYRDLLHETRLRILDIKNIVAAKTQVPDSETANEAWTRNIQSVINKLRSNDK